MELLSDATSQKRNVQQKMASQMPRGTRLDATGTRLEVKGARNYTSHPLYVGTDEIFEDIVIRGIRSDGFSSKFGVKNNKTSISKLISDVFKGDHRQQGVITHFNSKRQRSNAAKTVFATMTQDELKMIHNELIPSKVDLKIRQRLHEAFPQGEKLRHCAEVLQHLQHSFSHLDHETELLSIHNFQSRGFFADVITSISNFLMQVVDDSSNQTNNNTSNRNEKESRDIYQEKEDETAAEILLSVGSAGAHHGTPSNPQVAVDMNRLAEQCLDANKLDEVHSSFGKEWTQLEIVDNGGQAKCFLVKTQKPNEGVLEEKLVQLLNDQTEVVCDNQINSNTFHNSQIVTPFTVAHEVAPITTLEISIDGNSPDCLIGKRSNIDQSEELAAKRLKT